MGDKRGLYITNPSLPVADSVDRYDAHAFRDALVAQGLRLPPA
ncbi:hypothetical protein [Variovorax rhizosphaerae]|uniref:Uncharacterized protein n=1 Tax=Variovorax rhizosphaerae TaxID=1836200 RepID=A0ABU8WL38_9BURK